MAYAILWIIFSHIRMPMPYAALTQFKAFGYGGCDIFFFASGIGCYFSLAKSEDALPFLKRRARKILPVYFIVILIWIGYRMIFDPLDVPSIIGNLLSAQQFTGKGNAFNWYISAMWLFYFAAPYVVGIVRKITKPYQEIGLLILVWLITVPFLGVDHLIIIATRIPIFVLGVVWGKRSYEEKPIGKCAVFLWMILMTTGIAFLLLFKFHMEDLMWSYGLYWYPFFFIVPGLCLAISMISELFEAHLHMHPVVGMLRIVGNHTFELFLLHVVIFEILNEQLIATGVIISRWRYWIAALLVLIPLCAILKNMGETIRKVIASEE
jgi:peptidoglycan/LPS O-acetylase OafA/YrhL